VRLPAECFLHRFLQHVLPQGFQRLRYFGWLSAAAKTKWQRILGWPSPRAAQCATAAGTDEGCKRLSCSAALAR